MSDKTNTLAVFALAFIVDSGIKSELISDEDRKLLVRITDKVLPDSQKEQEEILTNLIGSTLSQLRDYEHKEENK